MHVVSATRKGRWVGVLAAAVALVAGPAAAGATGGGEPGQREREAHARARAEVRALFDPGAGIETGDVVVEFDGERILGARELTSRCG